VLLKRLFLDEMERKSVSGHLVVVRTFVVAIVFGAAASTVWAAGTDNPGTSSLYRKGKDDPCVICFYSGPT